MGLPVGRLTPFLMRTIGTWGRTAQGLLAVALVLILFAASIAALGPADWRAPAVIGIFAGLVLLQAAVLWGMRGAMLTPYAQAQRAYLDGDFEGALALLQAQRGTRSGDMHVLTLLGNTYRQLGRLSESRSVLSQALDIAPDHYFPLYGFGRTLLAEGHYTEAAETIRRAMVANAPAVVQFDLADAHYRGNRFDDARRILETILPELHEPHRVLMATYLLYCLNAGDPPDMEALADGLAYWQASAERFRDTPYGAALTTDIHTMQSLAVKGT